MLAEAREKRRSGVRRVPPVSVRELDFEHGAERHRARDARVLREARDERAVPEAPDVPPRALVRRPVAAAVHLVEERERLVGDRASDGVRGVAVAVQECVGLFVGVGERGKDVVRRERHGERHKAAREDLGVARNVRRGAEHLGGAREAQAEEAGEHLVEDDGQAAPRARRVLGARRGGRAQRRVAHGKQVLARAHDVDEHALEERVDEAHPARAHHERLEEERAEAVLLDDDEALELGGDRRAVVVRERVVREAVRHVVHGVERGVRRACAAVRRGLVHLDAAVADVQRGRREPLAAPAVPRDVLAIDARLARVHRADRVSVVAPLKPEHLPLACGAPAERAGLARARDTRARRVGARRWVVAAHGRLERHLQRDLHARAPVVAEEHAVGPRTRRGKRVRPPPEQALRELQRGRIRRAGEEHMPVAPRGVRGGTRKARVAVPDALRPPRGTPVEHGAQRLAVERGERVAVRAVDGQHVVRRVPGVLCKRPPALAQRARRERLELRGARRVARAQMPHGGEQAGLGAGLGAVAPVHEAAVVCVHLCDVLGVGRGAHGRRSPPRAARPADGKDTDAELVVQQLLEVYVVAVVRRREEEHSVDVVATHAQALERGARRADAAQLARADEHDGQAQRAQQIRLRRAARRGGVHAARGLDDRGVRLRLCALRIEPRTHAAHDRGVLGVGGQGAGRGARGEVRRDGVGELDARCAGYVRRKGREWLRQCARRTRRPPRVRGRSRPV